MPETWTPAVLGVVIAAVGLQPAASLLLPSPPSPAPPVLMTVAEPAAGIAASDGEAEGRTTSSSRLLPLDSF